ncbi:SIS domain-containing protein [Aquincola tertiaricarbonis]|uniref:SIS domain-containing protein n=1 Tax=Aquincola tertiaricarbonis TaxID=391953 RepID=A0ABY4SGH9_AQUTE|nr:SIS domain-containing protein [Aquincola tertiaricarbonis]URI10116.1 SIS domain-containing protein [Aquincola tertiaricarbonis]
MLEQRIQQQFFESADLQVQAADTLARPLADAVHAVLGCITAGGKLMVCGSGGSTADAQHLAAQFVGRFERERPGLAALALGTDSVLSQSLARESGINDVLAKQVQALGLPGDVLLVLAPAGDDEAVIAAVQSAHGKDMTVIAFTGRQAPGLAAELMETDVQVAVPHDRAARIREIHVLALHCLCDAVDVQLMGEQEPNA